MSFSFFLSSEIEALVRGALIVMGVAMFRGCRSCCSSSTSDCANFNQRIMGKRQHRHIGAHSPFESGQHGQGPSARRWGRAHLDWLGVDFSDHWRLFDDTANNQHGLFPRTVFPVPGSSLAALLKDRLGLSWEEMDKLAPQHLPEHYKQLLKLCKPRNPREIYLEASTSVAATSPLSRLKPMHEYLHRSPCPESSTTPVLVYGADATCGVHARPSPPSSPPGVKRPDSAKLHLNHPQTPASKTFRTEDCSEVRGKQLSETKRYPFSPCGEMPATPIEGGTTQQSLPSGITLNTDSTYSTSPTTMPPPIQTADKPESEVAAAARSVLSVLEGALEVLAHPLEIDCNMRDSTPLRFVVEGLQCTCKPDIELEVRAVESAFQDKFGIVHGEFKRLLHGQSPDNILGQEVAILLSIAARQRHARGGHRAKAKRRRLLKGKLITVRFLALSCRSGSQQLIVADVFVFLAA
ncbi:hypothetical protein M409DRAFT_61625 [Zasmidium cellare ATCC 36951]|uniref:Uncharacterized protein n=1 Tax=Zasmidium cellare ATCC 36951 TaxID=1080233 RepID=A0A6A6BYI2_ZASCE|nr:uncharacterized protein M409DRAFT_61625 [Zasmidium cellare ATCC 36951]KAF2158466.1 hypothetical protein M409DRAFT_61625 [Zasmidium cellare ATCC 36951]